jgi:FkbM family methyltransferase
MAFNLGMSDRKGEKEIFSHVDHSPSSSFLKTTKICENYYPFTKTQEAISVRITTLDKWVSTISLPTESEILIKLDVQGYEDRVIFGGTKTFNIATACILEVNIESLYERQATFRDITTLLYELGFRYAGNLNQRYADDGHVIYIDAVFVKSKSTPL